MDEEISIINTNTRNEKIKNFFVRNKKKIFYVLSLIIIILISFFGLKEYKEKKKVEISNLYNSVTIQYDGTNKEKTVEFLIDLINSKDPTYSPLSLYFIIDNSLITEQKKINKFFDFIIEEISLDKEIRNLIILKKAYYNGDDASEKQLLDILKPILNSDSVWESHALYLLAEYFFTKGEKNKSEEFFNQILSLEKINDEIKIKTQKRLNRDLSE